MSRRRPAVLGLVGVGISSGPTGGTCVVRSRKHGCVRCHDREAERGHCRRVAHAPDVVEAGRVVVEESVAHQGERAGQRE